MALRRRHNPRQRLARRRSPRWPGSQPPTVKIGDKVRDDDYQFQVTKVTYGVSGVGDSYFGEKP